MGTKRFIVLFIFLHVSNPCNAVFLPYGPINGDTALGTGDDVSWKVTARERLKFLGTNTNQFYVSSNGAIFTKPYNQIDPSRSLQLFPKHSLLVYFADAKFDGSCSQNGCNVFSRTTLSSTDSTIVEGLIRKFDNNFRVDRNRSLVITWFKARAFHVGLDNTFQAVIASDGSKTYGILTYDQLNYYAKYRHRFAKVGFKANTGIFCQFPGSNIEPVKLACRSNVNKPGVFVVGLTTNSQFKCHQEKLPFDCSHCSGEETWLHTICTSQYDPVCGSNGRTFSNLCNLKKEACRSNGTVTFSHNGPCLRNTTTQRPSTRTMTGTGRGTDRTTRTRTVTGTGRGTDRTTRTRTGTGTGTGTSRTTRTPTVTGTGRGTDRTTRTRTVTGTGRGTDRTTRTRTVTGTGRGTDRTTRTRTVTGTGRGTDRTTRTRTGTPTRTATVNSTRPTTNPPISNTSALLFCGFDTGSCGFSGISVFGPWIRHRGATPTNGTGPFTDANGNTLGYYVYYEASTFTKASINVSYTYPGLPAIGCAHVSVHMFGSGVGTLRATLRPSFFRPIELFTISGNQGNQWHQYRINIPLFRKLDFSFEAIPTFDSRGDIALDNLTITNGACFNETRPSPSPNTSVTPSITTTPQVNTTTNVTVTHTIPYFNMTTTRRPVTTTPFPRRVFYCDFEDGTCGLSTGRWIRDCCGTPSSGTGPNVDATGSSRGYYIYREASGSSGSSSVITLNIQNPTRLSSGCLRFAYHMYGNRMGILRVFANPFATNRELFSISGNQGNTWYFRNISLNSNLRFRPTSIQIRFEGIIGSNYESDIALDEISVTLGGGSCEEARPNATSGSLLYPHGFSSFDSVATRGRFRITTVNLPQKIPLFTVKRNRFYISTNGIVSFDTALTHASIPSSNTHVSLFQHDLDNSRFGNIFYRYTTDPHILQRANRDVGRLGKTNFTSSSAIIITYSNVPASFSSGQLHTFQLVLTTDGNLTFAILNYQRLSRVSFLVGYSEKRCNFRRFGTSSGSLTFTSNVGIRGRHVYQLTNFNCFKPITDISVFSFHLYTSQGIDTRSYRFQLIPSSRVGTIDTAVLEIISPDLSIIFLKRLQERFQMSSTFSAVSGLKFVHMAVVYGGTPENSTFQYGQINTTAFSSNTDCVYEMFTERMMVTPSVKLTADIGPNGNDILRHTHIWLRDVSPEGFQVCYKEAYTFSGTRSILINYIAVAISSSFPNTTDQFKEHGRYQVNATNSQVCNRVSLKHHYIRNPQVFITPVQASTRSARSPVVAWLRTIGSNYFDVCVKSSSKDLSHSNIAVDYMVRGDISPCSYFSCPDHLECAVGIGNVPFCGCIKSCFNATKDVGFCGTDSTFYHNQCEIDRKHCLVNGNTTKSNVKVAYQGKCEGFPYQSGVTQLDNVPGVPVAFCKYISLKGNFHSSNQLYVQLSVSWGTPLVLNSTKNEASAVWSEDISVHGFKACVMVAGRHFFGIPNKPFVHWTVYQDGFVSGNGNMEAFVLNLTTWYTGSNCVNLRTKRFISFTTRVLVSVQHTLPRTYENAMVAWTESFGRRVCAREFQNFDGKHSGIKLHVLVIHSAKSLFINEHGTITFPRKFYSASTAIPAVCQTVQYNSNYPSLPNPTVLVSPTSTRYSGTFSSFGYTVWIENAGASTLSICYKSIRLNTRTDELRISYVVLPALCEPGWSYVSGSCYKPFRHCATYGNAKKQCNALNASLPTVNTGSEQYYLETSSTFQTWIGLTDQAVENKWVWSTGSQSSFRKWLPGRPNGGQTENCAVVDKIGNSSGWEDIRCSSCAHIQCERDANLLNRSCEHFCQNGGVCSSTVDPVSKDVNMTCTCPFGIYGNRCEIDVGALEECKNYTFHNESWRRLGSPTSFTLQSNDTSCDAKYLKDGWHRFGGAAGTQLYTTCTLSGNQCGTSSPGWVVGANPMVEDGIVTRMLQFRTFYCADDRGMVQIRNCGNFYTYKFIRLPYWSCRFGVCTMR